MIVRREEAATVWTVEELLKWTEGYFRRLGLLSPRLDAEVLLAHVLRKKRLELYTGYHMLVEPHERAQFRTFVERRAKHEPVAYITGSREFYSLRFEVTPAVLVPRPETEHLVDAALKAISSAAESPAARVLDLGTGSGCIAIAIAANAKAALVDATDLCPQALGVARRNAALHGVLERIRFFEGDLYGALPPAAEGYDVIVSNPPYVSASEYSRLMPDVRLHEPQAALLDVRSSTQDGLGFYRDLAQGASCRLRPSGVLAVEVGAGQAGAVREILASAGWLHRETIRDLGGVERVLVHAGASRLP